ncbi:hypothetical protein VZT92_024228 [Zoarces viviparus]|uniref:Resistance to inhibitors of cholinesterase protein 3 N-terminal domain-containing protein n=1 Tax=Zoarces viviparus TaxID=48416 RepID=A0AAW1E201_ZOAVI
MAMSTFQKVTLATCLVLCVALLLPKMLLSGGRKDAADGSGRFPSMMQRQAAPEGRGQRAASSRAHNTEATARPKGAGTGVGTGGKSNLAGQIIPVYGFGILLYILYILFKITSKGNNKPTESRFSSVRSENKKRKITDFELAQLQEKLRETELVMENIVSNVNHSPDRVKGVTADQEESLLQQLTEITRVMQEGQLMEDLAPQKKTQEDWEVPAHYPEEPEQQWEHSRCCCQHSKQPHSPQTETETERTQADGADLEDAPGDVAGGGDAAEGAEDLNKEREPDLTAVSEEDAGPERDSGADVEADASERRGAAGEVEAEEPEVTLTVMSVMEQAEELTETTETEASCSAVRRRNKRRRAKKASH